ncbi:MAG: phytanoyl-CoA dioxygenase family protein [Caldilineaceae bacterium]|nr:phytanoyl-CoA dioxygenase family protein [Caldilineaceae bacterium]
MNEQEKYLFDLQGFMTVPHALSGEQVAALNRIWDQKIAQDMETGATTQRWVGLLDWGQPFRELIDNPTISPYLAELLGERFRLDHDYADLIRSGKGPIGTRLHGGGFPYDPAQYYHFKGGKFYNGLTVVAYNLRDVNPGDGGFGCVPGSHKSNFQFPNEWRELEHMQPFMRAVTGPAGTAIIFTEALTHGTLPWAGAGERRTLFFKFSPFPISWSARYYDAEQYADLSERQTAILEAPNARYKGRGTYAAKRNAS